MDGIFRGNATRRSESRTAEVELSEQGQALEEVMGLVEETLRSRHHAAPVHTGEDMAFLAARFPLGVRCYMASRGKVVAGVVVFVTPTVVRLQ